MTNIKNKMMRSCFPRVSKIPTLEKTEGTIKSGQSRENGRDNQESTI
jgi:hypothetical protein